MATRNTRIEPVLRANRGSLARRASNGEAHTSLDLPGIAHCDSGKADFQVRFFGNRSRKQELDGRVDQKIEAEMRRIEQQSAVEVEKLLAATGKRIDGELQKLDAEMAKLKTSLDDRFAALQQQPEDDASPAKSDDSTN